MLHSIFKKQKTLYNISCARAVAQTASPLSCLCEHEQKLTVGVWKLQEEKKSVRETKSVKKRLSGP